MPELVIDVITSLTAFSPAEGCPGLWGVRGTEYLHWLEEEAAGISTVLVGSTAYWRFAGFADSGRPT
jgi:hypothetical protein